MSEKDADIALVFRGAGSTKMPLYAHPAPAPADRAARVAALVVAIDALEKLNERPRPMCRDCADCDGVCVNGSGLPCDMRKCIADARNSIDALAQLAGEA